MELIDPEALEPPSVRPMVEGRRQTGESALQSNLQISASQVTLSSMDPVVARSAYKHGYQHADIIHAFTLPIRSELLDDGLVMLVGPDRAANLLEVGFVETDEGPVIVHAMLARPKYLR